MQFAAFDANQMLVAVFTTHVSESDETSTPPPNQPSSPAPYYRTSTKSCSYFKNLLHDNHSRRKYADLYELLLKSKSSCVLWSTSTWENLAILIALSRYFSYVHVWSTFLSPHFVCFDYPYRQGCNAIHIRCVKTAFHIFTQEES